MEVTRPDPLSRSHVFAYLTPISTDAILVLESRYNNALLDDARTADGTSFARIKLDFRILFGRPSLSFGSSRYNEVVFPQAADIDSRHFALHFQMQTGLLLLTDTSRDGTWVSCGPTHTLQLIHNATQPIPQHAVIAFGRRGRCRFLVSLPDYARDASLFAELFQGYANSIDDPTSFAVKRWCAHCEPIERVEGRGGKQGYLCLNLVAKGGFGMVRTCLRVSDGAVFAVKSVVPQHSRNHLIRQMVLDEANLLRRIRHVSENGSSIPRIAVC